MSIGFVSANEIDEIELSRTLVKTEIHLGVFFDGTGNNMSRTVYDTFKHKRKRNKGERSQKMSDDEWLEKENIHPNVSVEDITSSDFSQDDTKAFSNVAILYSLFNKEKIKPKDKANSCLVQSFYVEGAGTADMSEDYLIEDKIGAGFGRGKTGVVALVSKAIKAVSDYLCSLGNLVTTETVVYFYLFGFSRGATCARLFANLWTRNPQDPSLPKESEFQDFLNDSYLRNNKYIPWNKLKYLNPAKIKIEFLGIYDTVAAIGVLQREDGTFSLPQNDSPLHFQNVPEYGLFLSEDTKKIRNVCHICALDEFRENFALVSVGDGSDVPSNCLEFFIPGCHSDIGGGYNNGEEQEIILHKNIEIKVDENSNEVRSSVLKNPKSTSHFDLSLENLSLMGWLQDNYENLDFDKKRRFEARTTVAIDANNYIKFKRFVWRGYSDIPLAMMKIYSKNQGADIFNRIPPQFDYRMHRLDLFELGNELTNMMKSLNGGARLFYYPEGSYLSSKYRNIRLRYLHFTSTDNMLNIDSLHGNRERLNWKMHEFHGSNIGNKPHFNLDGALSRMVYWGKNNDVNEMTCQNAIHHIYDFK